MKVAPLGRADAATLLARAVTADAAARALDAVVVDWRSHPWASATFVGARHVATLSVAGDAAAWLAALPEAAFVLRGHLVADIVAADTGDGLVRLEALTLVDA